MSGWKSKLKKSYRRDLVEVILVESTFSLLITAVVIVSFVGGVTLLGTFIEKLISENEQLKQENKQLRKVKRI